MLSGEYLCNVVLYVMRTNSCVAHLLLVKSLPCRRVFFSEDGRPPCPGVTMQHRSPLPVKTVDKESLKLTLSNQILTAETMLRVLVKTICQCQTFCLCSEGSGSATSKIPEGEDGVIKKGGCSILLFQCKLQTSTSLLPIFKMKYSEISTWVFSK